MTDKVMPLGLQKYTIKKVFLKWNPDGEPDNLDWDALEKGATFGENLENMKSMHPEYIWDDLLWRKWKYEEQAREEQAKHDLEKVLSDAGVSEDSVESFSKNADTGWQVERTELGETYSTVVEIKRHTAVAKGKKYAYGRIQITVDPEWVGLKATISVSKRQVLT